MTDLAERLDDALRCSGRRPTAQRRLILEALAEGGDHVDVLLLYDRVRARDPRVSLATVYRTLALFKDMGLVQEHRLIQDRPVYEVVRGQPRHHFTCLRCGRLIEFDAPLLERIEQELAEREGVTVASTHLHVSGYCADCRAEEREGAHHPAD